MGGIYAGVDYSMTSPGLCVIESDTDEEIKLYGFANAKYQGVYRVVDNFQQRKVKITLDAYPTEIKNSQDRYDKLSNWLLSYLPENVTHVTIEGYSFASKSGLICDIAENGSILKHKLWKRNISFSTIAPMSLKKFATNKGNADKHQMHESFKQELFDLPSAIGMKAGTKISSPVSDLVDAFFLAQHCQQNFT